MKIKTKIFFVTLFMGVILFIPNSVKGTYYQWYISENEDRSIIATLEDSTLIITGNGRMQDFKSETSNPWSDYIISNVIIESGIENIGNNAFSSCKHLRSVTIPNSVTKIGFKAFRDCPELTNVVIPDSVNYIGSLAFSVCVSLTEIVIPNGVTTINDGVFLSCKKLTSIIIPGSVTSIGNSAFRGCSDLTSITIPDSVINIEHSAFSGCSDLTNLDISDGVKHIGNLAFSSCISLEDIVVPNSVTTIDSGAFLYCEKLKSVTLSNNLTIIENSMFDGCTSLIEITIPKNVVTIDRAFNGSGLKKVIFEEGTTKIPDSILVDVDFIENVIIPDTVIEIGEQAFEGCASLGNIRIPGSVTKIGSKAFSNCTSLKEISILDNLSEIGYNIFDGTAIERVIFEEGTTKTTEGFCKNFSALNSVIIPKTVKELAKDLFRECTSLTEIKIPNGIRKINDGTFRGCSNLTNVTISDSVTSIGSGAFAYCTALTDITIPKYVTNIGGSIFSNCTELKSITMSNYLTEIGWNAFENCTKLTNITIPKDVTWIHSNTFRNCTSLTDIIIPYGVEIISESAFENCTNLKTIKMPGRLEQIGKSAFKDCINLTNINIPNCVFTIGESAFKNCISITNIELPLYSLKEIKDSTFEFCSSLKNITIPNNITKIGNYAFYGCSNLTNVTIPYKATSIGTYAFYNCSKLTNATISSSTTTIGDFAFAKCDLVTMYVRRKSYAEQYAIDNFIQYKFNIVNTSFTKIKDCEYTGQEIIPVISITDNSILLEQDVDYSVNYTNNVNVGTATITITGKGIYTGVATKTFNIVCKDISNAIISDMENKKYTGKQLTQDVIVKIGETTLVEDIDYTLIYENNINAGTATVIITGIGNYKGIVTKTFDIARVDISNASVSGIYDDTYTGEEITHHIVVKIGNTMLSNGWDCIVEYKNNINIGTATVIITGTGNYTGTIIKRFNIEYRDISLATVLNINDKTYTGKPIKQNVVIKYCDLTLKESIDYTLKYKDNINAGTATIIITGKGTFKGTITVNFSIYSISIEGKDVSVRLEKDIYQYTGDDSYPKVIVKNQYGDVLVEDVDYESYLEGIVNFGVQRVVIYGKGNYSGIITRTYTIVPRTVTGVKVRNQTNSSITLNWSIHEFITGYKVYSYNYKKKKWEYVGKTDKTSYIIKKLKAGTTYKFRVRAYKTIDGKQYLGEYSTSLKATTKTKTPSISKLSTKSKKVTIKWKKISGASGYQIYMSTSKKGNYSKIKTITKGSTTSYTKAKLKKNKKYYFKIRTYRTINGKKVYSSYSSVKSIKIK